jgi:hypothetical protein
MPPEPLMLFGVLMLSGLGAVGRLVVRLDIRAAQRATAALSADAVEDELQAMIRDTRDRARAPARASEIGGSEIK